jgi:hypothetical protein
LLGCGALVVVGLRGASTIGFCFIGRCLLVYAREGLTLPHLLPQRRL